MKNGLKAFFLIAGITFLAFANSLSNGFVGDDYVLFMDKSFYSDPANISKLATREFITDYSDLDPASYSGDNSFSGCVSYRPITALSFFMDHHFWQTNPFGYHLTNLILHVFCAFFVYILVSLILDENKIAILAALLFAVHPIQAEAVNNIGYRSDLLSVFFLLLALIGFLRQRKKGGGIALGPYFFFILSLLSKETAAALPFVLLLYDFCFLSSFEMRKAVKQYAVLFIILLAYLYIYLFVFPNATFPGFFAFDLLNQICLAARTFFHYISVLFWPFNVSVLPPMYQPAIDPTPVLEITISAVFVSFSFLTAVLFIGGYPAVTFFILWFLITYLPTANLMPLPNPFAYRYMYLPSIGFFAVAAICMEKAAVRLKPRDHSLNPGLILKTLIVGLCVTITLPHNELFKNNIILCREMIKRYPDASRPHWVLGLIYLAARQYDKAIVHFNRYLELGAGNPFMERMDQDYFVHHQLGRCYVNDPDKAIKEFKKAVNLRPEYVPAYADLAKAYILKKDFRQSLYYALETIRLREDGLIGYIYAIHSSIELKDKKRAEELFQKARRLSPHDGNLEFLKEYMERKL